MKGSSAISSSLRAQSAGASSSSSPSWARWLGARLVLLCVLSFVVFQALFLYVMVSKHQFFGDSLQDIRELTSTHSLSSVFASPRKEFLPVQRNVRSALQTLHVDEKTREKEKEKEKEREEEEEGDEEKNLPTKIKTDRQTRRYAAQPVHLLSPSSARAVRAAIPAASLSLLETLLGPLPFVDLADLRYRPGTEVRAATERVFRELPPRFLDDYKNPCFLRDDDEKHDKTRAESNIGRIECLPYAYVLGQPKCGTSDLFERLRRHAQVVAPRRKEVRWFTRGEFSTARLSREDDERESEREREKEREGEKERRIGRSSSLSSFTRHFAPLAQLVQRDREGRERPEETDVRSLITFDGGPHTLWWPTQQPDGSAAAIDDVPPAQLLREMQPRAKMILSLCDPVKRLYSDYYFLADDLRPVRRIARARERESEMERVSHVKTARQLHDRVVIQISRFDDCVDAYMSTLLRQWQELLRSESEEEKQERIQRERATEGSRVKLHLKNALYEEHLPLWFRSSQMCAHDRHAFATAGWGRLSIGLYSLFLAKWLEHFPPSAFHALALEEFSLSPREYLASVHRFLGLSLSQSNDSSADGALREKHANAFAGEREAMWESTRRALDEFYRPYNLLLARMLQRDVFLFRGNRSLSSDAGQGEREGEREGEDAAHHRLFDALHGARQEDASALIVTTQKPAPPQLRGAAPTAPQRDALTLSPRRFAADALPLPEDFQLRDAKHEALRDLDWATIDAPTAALRLCEAAFRMNVASLALLLHETGVDGALRTVHGRNAWHCLASVFTFGDAHSKSQVFAELKGEVSWLSALLQPPLHLQMDSVASRDIVARLANHSERAAQWLTAAEVPLNAADRSGYIPLHLAVLGGEHRLVRYMLHHKAEPNAVTREGRTPAHYAAALGHAQILGLLRDFGADLQVKDRSGVSAWEIVSAPGPISRADAKRYLNVTQRAARQISRVLQPETWSSNNNETLDTQSLNYRGWPAGDGGWNLDRLAGTEEDLDCPNIDQFYAHEITAEQVYDHYLARNTPVMIRGLLHSLAEKISQRFSKTALAQRFGNMSVTVSDIPYAAKFGGKPSMTMTLAEYITRLEAEHARENATSDILSGYVFKGHPIPAATEREDSLVPYSALPTPWALQAAFAHAASSASHSSDGSDKSTLTAPEPLESERRPREREIFVNAQWAFGGPGTGAPVHFHNTAWSALLYGAKKWFIYSPHNAIMSNKQIYDFLQSDAETFATFATFATKDVEQGTPADREADREEALPYSTCVQTAGDVVIIPESWGHGVLNLQDSIAVATECRQSLFRLSPGVNMLRSSPAFDNLKGRQRVLPEKIRN